MEKPRILCVDDQREVLRALRNDLEELGRTFTLVECESAPEAEEVLDEIDAEGERVGVIVCDHVMPEKSGVDFLAGVEEDARFAHTRKLLLTGLATHRDTIRAINQAGIDRYIEKPWEVGELVAAVRRLMTEYVVQAGMEYEAFMEALDQQVLYEELRKRV